MIAERKRLEQQQQGEENWRLWGPYLSERAWGTVREDYSPDGEAWDYFDHEQARFRAYRWSEDGLGGISDNEQQLCLALALWNGHDPFLKERAFGLTGSQSNHGEDVKEEYFYLDATPSHSYLRYLYKYPQAEYPYQRLVDENQRSSSGNSPFNLLDTGVFDEDRYWDVELVYAKADYETIHLRIMVHNRGPEKATLHLLPTLWFRNDWSWESTGVEKPLIKTITPPNGAAWAVSATHPTLGGYLLFGRDSDAHLLFTENESNRAHLWGDENASPYVKDAFHRRVVHGKKEAVNPAETGTKFAAWSTLEVEAGTSAHLDLVLCKEYSHFLGFQPFRRFERILERNQHEANVFYLSILPEASDGDAAIFRQALAGLIWSKQFYHYEVSPWLDGDGSFATEARRNGRNTTWQHFKSADIISMPDKWEFPWFAAWDLAFHSIAFALIDIDFAKEQLELLLSERFLHPNGQIPAYEWNFRDVNPPIHAFAALECYRMEKQQRGKADRAFLLRIFNKLMLNYGWWLNWKDADSRNVFEGGFMGLDNISVYDRSKPLPEGVSLKQADATGWMAMFALNMTVMALELAQEEPSYEDMAIQIHSQFFAIAASSHGYNERGINLWDSEDKFFKDALETPEGVFHLPVYSWVGLIPLFGCEIISNEKMERVPRYREFLRGHAGGFYDGGMVCACPNMLNARGDHLFTLTQPANLAAIVERVLDEDQFLSPFGVRSLSKIHAHQQELGHVPSLGAIQISYEPGESLTSIFGSNSNWRGPVWFPLNYMLVCALDRFHRYLGDTFTVNAPVCGSEPVTLKQAANTVVESMNDLFRRGIGGKRPIFPTDSPFQHDPYWKELLHFYEYFHGDTGQGLGAAHQTGWTALVANLMLRQYRE